jgi:NAD(P)H-dependent flavin oxidoreductase YrpB (nitropropane dioxygenase family)
VRETEAEFPGDFSKIADLVRGDNYKKAFLETGDPNDSVWSCGQSIGLIEDVPTCRQLLLDITAEAEQILSTGSSYIIAPASKL